MSAVADIAPLIEELNRLWLEAAREAAITDVKAAVLAFGLSEEEVIALKQKPLVEILEGAKSPVALFAPREALRQWLKINATTAHDRKSIVQALLRDVGANVSSRASPKNGVTK